MALANIAVLLARSGKKVLIVDWDLEAPGMERYFKDFEILHTSKEKRGLLNLLHDASNSFPRNIPNWEDYLSFIYIKDNSIDFLTSGRKDDESSQKEHAKKLYNFDWNKFYKDYDGSEFIESLRKQWLNNYEIIFIDSRTGITDSGGICTI